LREHVKGDGAVQLRATVSVKPVVAFSVNDSEEVAPEARVSEFALSDPLKSAM
jgi:hypothetical protein